MQELQRKKMRMAAFTYQMGQSTGHTRNDPQLVKLEVSDIIDPAT